MLSCRAAREIQSESDRPNGHVNTLFKYMPPVNNSISVTG